MHFSYGQLIKPRRIYILEMKKEFQSTKEDYKRWWNWKFQYQHYEILRTSINTRRSYEKQINKRFFSTVRKKENTMQNNIFGTQKSFIHFHN